MKTPSGSIPELPNLVAFHQVHKSYAAGGGRQRQVLRGITLNIPAGCTMALTGRSGSGKSTLLNLAAGIDVPSSGRIELFGQDLGRLADGQRARQRRDGVGMIFQFFHLIPHLTVAENVALPALIAGERQGVYGPRRDALLQRVGMVERSRDGVHGLSGGEMQRVALCRALLRRPRLVLADEPTGSLDDTAGRVVMDLMLEMVREEGAALVYATHDLELAGEADQQWRLHHGLLEPA